MGVWAGFDADVWVTAVPSIGVTNEACTYTQGAGGLSCTFKTNTHKLWDKSATTKIETSPDGTTWTDMTAAYWRFFQWVSGILALPFDLPGTQMRFSGSYFNASQVRDCHTWELTVTANEQNTTVFQQPWQTHTVTNKMATGKIGTFIIDDTLSKNIGNELAFLLYMSKTTGAAWEFFGSLTQTDPKSDVNAIQTQDVSFVSNGQVIFYLTGA
jgi:hypothetical protein